MDCGFTTTLNQGFQVKARYCGFRIKIVTDNIREKYYTVHHTIRGTTSQDGVENLRTPHTVPDRRGAVEKSSLEMVRIDATRVSRPGHLIAHLHSISSLLSKTSAWRTQCSNDN